MRQLKHACRHKCRFIQISDGLWLCPHASYGFSSNLKGAVEEARMLLERAGGYDKMLARIVAAEDEKRRARKERAGRPSVRYDR